jgi:hypothetical protein
MGSALEHIVGFRTDDLKLSDSESTEFVTAGSMILRPLVAVGGDGL